MKNIFDIESFKKVIIDSLNNITQLMIQNKGVEHIVRNRLKFEKWFQVELLNQVLIRTESYDVSIINEIEVSEKKTKKGFTIDIGFLIDGVKFLGLELKVVPTNYDVEGIVKKSKKISDDINSLKADLEKVISDNYIFASSIAFIYPFPMDTKSRNYKDFEKQTSKIKDSLFLELEANISTNFKSYYYVLLKSNKKYAISNS